LNPFRLALFILVKDAERLGRGQEKRKFARELLRMATGGKF
jgi:hypothetical protein